MVNFGYDDERWEKETKNKRNKKEVSVTAQLIRRFRLKLVFWLPGDTRATTSLFTF